MSERPIASFVITLIGGILGVIFAGIVLALEKSIISAAFHQIAGVPGHTVSLALSIALAMFGWFIVASIILIIASFLIYTGEPSKVKKGGILAIIFGILNFLNCNFIPLILGIIGGVLAYSWASRKLKAQQAIPEVREYYPEGFRETREESKGEEGEETQP